MSTSNYTESEEISNNECTLVLDDLDVVDTVIAEILEDANNPNLN